MLAIPSGNNSTGLGHWYGAAANTNSNSANGNALPHPTSISIVPQISGGAADNPSANALPSGPILLMVILFAGALLLAHHEGYL